MTILGPRRRDDDARASGPDPAGTQEAGHVEAEPGAARGAEAGAATGDDAPERAAAPGRDHAVRTGEPRMLHDREVGFAVGAGAPIGDAPPDSPTVAPVPPLPPPPPHPRNPDDAVNYGLRVTAGYAWRLIVIAVAVYGLFVMFGKVQFVAVALFAGLVISALLRPLADVLHRALPRGPAVALAVLSGILFVVAVFTFITTSVVTQYSSLQDQFTNGINKIERTLRQGPLHLSTSDVNHYVDAVRNWLTTHQSQLAGQALNQASSAFEVLTGLALAVFTAIFFIHGGDRMWRWFVAQLPESSQRIWDEAGRAAWGTFAGYTRGIVIVSASNSLIVCIGLLALRVPLAFPLALLVFFLSFIPLVGAPTAMAVATVVALAARGPWTALGVLIMIVLVGQFEGHVLHPLVMSRAVSIHPIAVAIAVATGTVLSGVIGAVMAVPLVSVTWSVRRRLQAVRAAQLRR